MQRLLAGTRPGAAAEQHRGGNDAHRAGAGAPPSGAFGGHSVCWSSFCAENGHAAPHEQTACYKTVITFICLCNKPVRLYRSQRLCMRSLADCLVQCGRQRIRRLQRRSRGRRSRRLSWSASRSAQTPSSGGSPPRAASCSRYSCDRCRSRQSNMQVGHQ